MKNFLRWFIPFFCIYIFICCSEMGPTGDSFTKYNGTWLWLYTVGGFAPRIYRSPNGSTIKISYDKFGKFKIYRNDSLKVIASYYIEQAEHNCDKLFYSNVVTSNFYFDSEPDYPTIQTDTLVLWDGMIDGYFSFYKKLY